MHTRTAKNGDIHFHDGKKEGEKTDFPVVDCSVFLEEGCGVDSCGNHVLGISNSVSHMSRCC